MQGLDEAGGRMNLGHIDLTQTPRGCVVPDDPGMVVRSARPMTDADRAVLREQWIAKVQEGR